MADIRFIAPMLLAFSNRYPFELVICSDNRKLYQEKITALGVRSVYVEYDPETFPELLNEANGVILPITVIEPS